MKAVLAFLCFLALFSAALEAAEPPATPDEPSLEWCSSAKKKERTIRIWGKNVKRQRILHCCALYFVDGDASWLNAAGLIDSDSESVLSKVTRILIERP